MFAFAVVDLGINPKYFWEELSDVEYSYLVDRYNAKKIDDFEPFRLLAYIISTGNGMEGDYDSFLNLYNEETSGGDANMENVEERKKFLIELYKSSNV